jgi:hypothetical protein
MWSSVDFDLYHFSFLKCNYYILIDTALFIVEAGLLQQMVDKIPDQFLLNTTSWRFLIPRLYRGNPDDDMLLDISAVNVLDFGEIVPVSCLSVVRFYPSLL